jgi:hypothetical protein
MNQNMLTSHPRSTSCPPSPISEDEEEIFSSRIQDEENIRNLEIPQASPIKGLHAPDPHRPSFMVLATGFNINAEQNKKVQYPQGEDQKAERIAYMDRQREFAGKAIVPKDIEDFSNIVTIFF